MSRYGPPITNEAITIRVEGPEDAALITDVIKRAYQDVPYSDQREYLMVSRLRGGRGYIRELSLLAEVNGQAVGHVLLTAVIIRGPRSTAASLALAPLSVVPEFQRQGVGRRLVAEAHRRARGLGFGSVIVIGPSAYYPRFGYEPLDRYPITLPFAVPERNRMIAALTPDGLAGVSGMVEYAPEWMAGPGQNGA